MAGDVHADLDERRFHVDAGTDGTLIGLGVALGGFQELLISTGELKPQKPGAPDRLLGLDRAALGHPFDPFASTYSNVGLLLAIGYAGVEPVVEGARTTRRSGVTDGTLYAESLALTWALTDLVKLAVRRPRPRTYGASEGDEGTTDDSLSFFSGHAAITSTVGATATYLAFSRGTTPRSWATLGGAVVLDFVVGYGRVRAGAHFPTDVFAGTLIGAAIGVLVPHLHRTTNVDATSSTSSSVSISSPGAPLSPTMTFGSTF